jgi:hypothetical protein
VDRALALIALASLGGVATLWIVAQTSDFPTVTVADLGAHAGTTVQVNGRLIEVREFPGGFARALLVDANRSVPLVSRGGVGAASGDLVIVEARVVLEQGRLELEVEGPQDIRVVGAWRENAIPLERLLADPWSHRSSNVRTWGTLDLQGKTAWLRSTVTESAVALVGATSDQAGACDLEGRFEYEPQRAGFRIHVTTLACTPSQVA